MAIHELKIRPRYYESVIKGEKTFEIRFNDRNYDVGDTLILKEWDDNGYSGRESMFDVTYILKDFEAINNNYVVMSIKPHH